MTLGVSQENNLSKRQALISGGSSGIGKAIAAQLSAKGAATAIADLTSAATTPNDNFYNCNITNPTDIDSLFQQLQQKNQLPDTLICCAGRGIHEKLTEGDPAKWQQVLELNIMGALRLIRAFVPQMLERGFGDVVLVSSVAAGKAFEYGGVYAASKAALETIAETLRLEVLPQVRVFTIAPGVTDTRFFENEISGYKTVENMGLGALSADEVAEAVVYALSRPRHVAWNHLTLRPAHQPF
ncbi:MAG: SDR family NAD(P)-dependent oxidoreductase [Hymenobacteraceae bacterium]|nr:SDR family NAD(P)-dependent oxidoreductase [Hymenobacteraceae bacterium]MDX5395641.1 SDR family NAD(P)-dependent oxidoreductase [Hymenobacteraceae bacterium]MDX5442968.1 SDR family NAD(P)-dependent oxidoreductase [Hymenobacteraceae bacterium]MDX5511695.1 SDR family NAD(P)-dependent oxidoreductase [Hymenobacteraceae bacterium]